MTNLTVDGVSYDLERAIQHAAIRDLVDLKRATQVGGQGGISIKSIVSALEAMQSFESPMDMFDSIETLETFAALVFLCKRYAGETVTFSEAASISLASVGLEVEDDDAEVAEPDPKGR